MAQLGPIKDLTSARIIRIPAYQRGYAWKEENWKHLVDDVTSNPDEFNHYCGPIIYSSQDDFIQLEGAVRDKLEIVHIEDGQQRISTLIFAAHNFIQLVEGDQSYEECDFLAEELRKDVVFYAKSKKAKRSEFNLPRLQSANDEFNRFLQDLFSNRNPEPFNAPTRRIKKMNDEIARTYAALNSDELGNLGQRLFEALRFVFVDLAPESINPHVAFHTINSRGVPLREFDKVKNGVMSVAESRGNDELAKRVEQAWFQVITKLDDHDLASAEDDFLGWSFALHFQKPEPVKNTLATTVLKLFDKCDTEEALYRVEECITSWELYVGPYTFICRRDKQALYSDQRTKKHFNNYVHNLRRFDSMGFPGIAKPLLIAGELVITDDEEKELFSAVIEKFVFRVFSVGKRRIDHLKKEIRELATKYANGLISLQTVIDELLKWVVEQGSLQKCLNDLFDSDRLHYGDWKQLDYFLLEYEHYLSNRAGHPLIWKDHQIEHIAPQQQSGSYSEYLRFDALKMPWQRAFGNAKTWRLNLHRLGNLCLTQANSALGNQSWEDKNSYYQSREATHGERELQTFIESTWDEKAILCREISLAKFFVYRWNLGFDSESKVELPRNFTVMIDSLTIGQGVKVIRKEEDFDDKTGKKTGAQEEDMELQDD